MKHHDFFKKAARWLARQGFKCCVCVSRVVPYPIFCYIVRTAVFILLYRTNSRLARNCRRSIEIAYGDEKSPEEKERLLIDSLRHLGQVIAETVYYARNPKFVEDKIDIQGRDHLDRALARGKGVVAVTAHFGNFPAMIYWMAQIGYKINVVMRRLRDEKIGEYVFETVSRSGVRIIYTIPTRQCIEHCLACLRRNEILFVLLDQNYGADARVFTDFFGHQAATGTSPVVFAQRTGAAVVPMFCLRRPKDRHVIAVEPEVSFQTAAEQKDTVRQNVQQLTDVIERYIRKDPAWWSWMHNRWKGEAA